MLVYDVTIIIDDNDGDEIKPRSEYSHFYMRVTDTHTHMQSMIVFLKKSITLPCYDAKVFADQHDLLLYVSLHDYITLALLFRYTIYKIML